MTPHPLRLSMLCLSFGLAFGLASCDRHEPLPPPAPPTAPDPDAPPPGSQAAEAIGASDTVVTRP